MNVLASDDIIQDATQGLGRLIRVHLHQLGLISPIWSLVAINLFAFDWITAWKMPISKSFQILCTMEGANCKLMVYKVHGFHVWKLMIYKCD